MKLRAPIALGLATLALGAAGCGDDDEDTAAPTPTEPRAETTAPPNQPTATTPSAGRSAVTISGTEYKFTPENPTVKAGQITFRLRNDGGAPHALEVEGEGIEKETEVIQGGETTELRVTLKPGKYTIYCPVGNHRDLGMVGTLTVT